MSYESITYCTDEAIAKWASEDYSILTPVDQKVWAGTDGVFSSDNRWALSSASIDPLAAGVTAGMLVLLTAPTANFKKPGELLVVSSVATNVVTLKRRLTTSAGVPPGPSTGVSAVEFSCLSLQVQIEQMSYRINQLFGMSTQRGVKPADLLDTRELEQLCAYGVLAEQYANRAHTMETKDAFVAKAERFKNLFNELRSNLNVHLNATLAGPKEISSTSGRFVR
jgi:hypothetical protein